MEKTGNPRLALIALVFMAFIGALVIFLFPGSPEQDVDYHFLMARTAWVDHFYFVDVWGRPLFTTLFAPVALLGFIPARFLALAISVVAAWQTYRLACDLRLSRAWLVIPFLLGQQTFFELYTSLFTEPLFALILVVALRLHLGTPSTPASPGTPATDIRYGGRIKSGMLVASLLPLARPEGVFVCLFWGLWSLVTSESGRQNKLTQSPARNASRSDAGGRRAAEAEQRQMDSQKGTKITKFGQKAFHQSRITNHRSFLTFHRLGSISILASGVLLWWLAALLLTGDPLFISHNWPATWHTDMYGHGTFFSYAQRSQEFAGVILIVPCIVGLVRGFRSRSLALITSVFLVLFLLHSIFVKYGLFGEAGFPRYMVSVAPTIALLTLEGWNAIFSVKILRPVATIAAWVVIPFSILQSVHYLDGMIWTRDAVAIDEMNREWTQIYANKITSSEQQDPSVPGLIWSNGRMCIDFQRNLKDSPPAVNREKLLTRLESAPAGSIVFWDNEIGSNWFGTTAAEIEGRGYKLLISRHYSLPALIFPPGRFSDILSASLFPPLPSREIELSLLEKGEGVRGER